MDVVLCTHGDVIPDVLRALSNNGLRLRDGAHWAKGSIWALSGKGHHLTEGRYLPPVEAWTWDRALATTEAVSPAGSRNR